MQADTLLNNEVALHMDSEMGEWMGMEEGALAQRHGPGSGRGEGGRMQECSVTGKKTCEARRVKGIVPEDGNDGQHLYHAAVEMKSGICSGAG